MKDYNSLTRWERFTAFVRTGHIHKWDEGHLWVQEDDPDGDTGWYFLCTECGTRKVTEYPC